MDIRGFRVFDLYNDLGICGCGMPSEAYERVYEMLVRARNREKLIVVSDDHPDCGFHYFMAYISSITGSTSMTHGLPRREKQRSSLLS